MAGEGARRLYKKARFLYNLNMVLDNRSTGFCERCQGQYRLVAYLNRFSGL
jgi:hypothetical protein